MDFLNKSFAQLSDLFRSMTPGARITAGLLLVVVVISLGYLFRYQVSGPAVDLMNGVVVPAGQIATMEAAFAKGGLEPPEIRGTQIFVPRSKKLRYLAALADDNALPASIENVFPQALQETGAFTSDKERDQRLKIATERKLGMIIREMNGIENAYVMYSVQTKSGLRREKVTTASANVKPSGSQSLDVTQVKSIRKLVAAAIGGLKYQAVTVTDLNRGKTYSGDPDSVVSADDNPYATLKREYEQDYRQRILSVLSPIPGVVVEPEVTLNDELTSRTKRVKHDPKPVSYSEMDQSSSKTTDDAGPAGRPGLTAQGNVGQTLGPSRSKGMHQDQEETQRQVLSVVSGEETDFQTAGLTPERVSVAVSVPSSYFEKVWRQQNPVEEGQEPQPPDRAELDQLIAQETTKIKGCVATVLPQATGVTDLTELVTVTTFQDIPGEALPVPGMSENAMVWLGQHWSTLGMLGLATFSLVMLRSMVHAAPTAPETLGPQGIVSAETEVDEEAAAAAAKRLGRFSGSGPSLRDELSELVQEDPEAAANILQAWIGSAG